MLKRMELWDFESHEHTVVEDLSPGLNLICGESNAGKTSIVRALKLVSQNEFDPRSIRVGATKCKVLVETERGTVKVTRGSKNNLWEVTPEGQPTQFFDKVGKGVVPMAAQIIGLHTVTLGDVQVPVNIMDQLESHFMLAGVGGKDASGSMRAQIVDEISGLSGIEGLIKDVSLDNYRFGREVKETEDKMEATRKQLHDEGELNREEAVLDKGDRLIQEHDDYRKASSDGQATLHEWNSSVEENNRLAASLDAIPDVDSAGNLLAGVDSNLSKAGRAREILGDAGRSVQSGERLDKALRGMPDETKAAGALGEAEKAIGVVQAARRLSEEAEGVSERKAALEVAWGSLDGSERAVGLLDEVGRLLGRVVAAAAAKKEADVARWGVCALKTEMAECEGRLGKAETERDGILASVKTCPLTLRPVSKECLEGAK